MGEIKLAEIICILKQIRPFGEFEGDTLLFDSGYIDSLVIFDRLLPALEEKYQITIEPYELVPENFETPEAILKYVERKRQEAG